MKLLRTLFLGMSLLMSVPAVAPGQEIEVSGEVGAEARWFPEPPQFQGQHDGIQPSVFIEPEVAWESDDRNQQVTFIPFLRLDGRDDERTHGDVREAYWRYIGDDWEFLAGANRVFWGVTESRHLVNVINQIDQVENTDDEDFLGQPMLNLALQRDYGRIEIFLMPYFRERTFAGTEGRLRSATPVDDGAVTYDAGAQEFHPDIAVRYSHFLGDWDVGLSYFHGTSREATLVPNASEDRLTPHYDLIDQAGLELQYTYEEWLVKLEAIGRTGQGQAFGAAVGGVEYTLFQVADSDADLGFLAEVLIDGRDQTKSPPTLFDHDVFVGTRLALNDVQDTNVLIGAVTDWEDGTTSLRVEADRRLGDSWRLELEGQWIANVDKSNAATAFKEDSFGVLRLTKFF